MAADNSVRYARAYKRLLNNIGLIIHSVQNGKIAEISAARFSLKYFIGNIFRFIKVALRDNGGYFVTATVIRPQIFAFAVFVIGNNAVCGIKNILG